MRIGGSTLSVLDFGNDFTTQIFRTVNDFVLCTSSTGTGQERLRITSTGNVGIGTNNPSSLLHVNGVIRLGTYAWHVDTSSNERFYFDATDKVIFIKGGTNTLTIFKNSSDADSFTIFGNGNYSARGSSQAWSDSRIKKDIEDINDDTALQMILAIEPKTYKYIDGNKSKERVYGFIAQQIREVIPEAVVLVDNIIPNIYKNCICEDNKRIYIVLPQDVLGSLIRIGIGGSYKIILVESDYIEVEKYMESKNIPDGEQFVYGYEVNDFHTINKEYIFTLNVCATQELHRRIEAQSVLLKSQDDRIKDLEEKVAMLLSNTT